MHWCEKGKASYIMCWLIVVLLYNSRLTSEVVVF